MTHAPSHKANRYLSLISRMLLALPMLVVLLPHQAQAQFNVTPPAVTTYYLDENCSGVFDLAGQPPVVTSTIGANIITPPTGLDAALTGYDFGDPVFGVQGINLAWVAADDQGNIDTFFFSINYTDTLPPVFTSPTPPDLFIDCAEDYPPPFARTATDNCNPPTIVATAADNPPPPGSNCGTETTIVRTWTAIDALGNTTIDTQLITIGVDLIPPDMGTPPADGTFSCDFTDYQTWLTTQRNTILIDATDNCSILTLTDDAPPSFDEGCGSVTVLFTLSDGCGLTDTASATYTVIDTVPPTLMGLPADTTIDCSAMIPAPPSLSATDNCDANPPMPTFSETTTQTSDSTCTDYSYQIIRSWVVSDGCGNTDSVAQVITVIDTIAPTFSPPADTALDCTLGDIDPSITGEPFDLSDNCGVSFSVTFSDETDTLSCDQNLLIERTWTVTDACGNSSSSVQMISLVDTIPPSFIPPTDTVFIDCSQVGDDSLTGMPTDLLDQCDDAPTMTLSQTTTDVLCTNSYTLLRTWYISDACGNTDSTTQAVIVRDTTPPTFTTPGQDFSIACVSDSLSEAEFANWVSQNGNAIVEDDCPGGMFFWEAYISGTNLPPVLPAPTCADSLPGIYRQQQVDFIVSDACGNTNMTTATFTVTDTEPPLITFCPSDTTVVAADSLCEASLTLLPPLVEESCGLNAINLNYTQNQPITSQGPFGDLDIIVDTLFFNIPVAPAPAQATGPVTLTIDLNGVDGDGSTEFFFVFGETGPTLGQTNNTPWQCQDTSTVFTVPASVYNQWAQDGLVMITLVPNVPPSLPTRFSVNNICPDASVDASLAYPAATPPGLTYEYRIGGTSGQRLPLIPLGPITATFPVGTTLVEYFVSDCAGNESKCAFNVIVVDNQAPELICPSDLSLPTASASCQAETSIPLLSDITDNCLVGSSFSTMVPTDPQESLLTFFFDPDLQDYLAENKTFTFTGLPPTTTGNVILTFTLLGDIDSADEYFTIRDPDGTILGTTEIGQPHVVPGDCDNPSIITFEIPATLFNTWAAAGPVTFEAESYIFFSIPPGGPGSGINPCEPGNVNQSGDDDGVSFMTATLSFQDLFLTYSGSGATTLPITPITDLTQIPMEVLNQGTTTIELTALDQAGNAGVCTYEIEVIDQEAPTALCEPTFVQINASGILIDTIQASEIDAGSFDNCGIDSMWVTPSIITCDFIGDTLSIQLFVQDAAGNTDQCTALVNIQGDPPAPTFFLEECGADTLYLFANPPMPPDEDDYLYSWSGPGFTSSQPNPIVLNPTIMNAGTYSVTITGITGCTATGEVQVGVNELPITPDLFFEQDSICGNETIILKTGAVSGSQDIQYQWYAADGTLLGTTATPSFPIAGPHPEGDFCYYVVVIRDGCPSLPSSTECVYVTVPPVAITNDPTINICEGGSFQLGTPISNPGVITYQWTGPISSTQQFPPAINNVTNFFDGVYTLVIFENGCPSAPAFTVVNVLNTPDQPVVSNTTTQANPACVGDSIVLSASVQDGTVYEWITPDFDTLITTNSSLVINSATLVDHQGEWTLQVFDGGCVSSLSEPSTVYVAPLPIVSPGSNSPVCDNEQLQLTINLPMNGAVTWTDPLGNTYNDPNPVLPPLAGTYGVQVTSGFGCVNTGSTQVAVNEAPAITSLSNNALTCPDGPTDILLFATLSPPGAVNFDFDWGGGPTGTYASTDSIAIIPNATEAQNGVYNLQVTDENGCVSNLASTTVEMGTILPSPVTPSFSGSAPYCEGENVVISTTDIFDGTVESYRWHTPNNGIQTTSIPSLSLSNLSLSDAGNYFLVVEVDGCPTDTSGIATLQVNPIPEISPTSNSPVCEGESIELYVDCFSGQTTSFSWFKAPDFSSSLCQPVILDAEVDNGGIYEINVTVNGCTSATGTVNVIVYEQPTKPILNSSGNVCLDDPDAELILSITPSSSTPGASYTWYHTDLGQIAGPSTSLVQIITDFSAFSAGSNGFYVIAEKNECTSAPSNTLLVTFNNIPPNQANAGMDMQVCVGDIVNLNASAPSIGTGQWSIVSGNPNGVAISNPDMAITTASGFSGGQTYQLAWSLSNGACMNYSIDTVEIFIDIPETAMGGPNIDTCATNAVQLNATPPQFGMGFWDQPSGQVGAMVEIEDPDDPNTTVSNLFPGNEYLFIWTLEDQGCGTSIDTVFVRVIDAQASAGTDLEDCGEGCTQLNAELPDVGFGLWSSPDPFLLFEDPSDPNSGVCDLMSGENILIWTLNNGICGPNGADTIIVDYKYQPEAVDDFQSVNFAEVITFSVSENDEKPTDFFINILVEPQHGTLLWEENGEVTYQADIDYVGQDVFVYEICSEGCACSTAAVTLSVGGNATCDIPTVITPNQDGVNDIFVIPCLSDVSAYPNNEVAIFNQWGDEVFRSAPYRNNWGGTYSGDDLPAGTYFFVVDFGDGSEVQTGFLILQR
jgi:gliding motility-associated-like protein